MWSEPNPFFASASSVCAPSARVSSSLLRAPIGFFAHSHGSGHLRRCQAIADALEVPSVIFTGRAEGAEDPRVSLLPSDDWGSTGGRLREHAGPCNESLHDAPLGVSGVQVRAAQIASWAAHGRARLLVVDVSVEVTLLARLCGIPTAVVRMHGRRDDMPHVEAYRSASMLLAPFSEEMEQPETPEWIRQKTVYAGCLARTRPASLQRARRADERPVLLCVTGQGGERFEVEQLCALARVLKPWHVVVAGRTSAPAERALPENLTLLGFTDALHDWMQRADVVMGSVGDNMVAEVAHHNKPFVCVPADRPFDEQRVKAQCLERMGVAVCIDGLDRVGCWPTLMERARSAPSAWHLLRTQGAPERAAGALEGLIRELQYVQG